MPHFFSERYRIHRMIRITEMDTTAIQFRWKVLLSGKKQWKKPHSKMLIQHCRILPGKYSVNGIPFDTDAVCSVTQRPPQDKKADAIRKRRYSSSMPVS